MAYLNTFITTLKLSTRQAKTWHLLPLQIGANLETNTLIASAQVLNYEFEFSIYLFPSNDFII